MVPNDLKQSCWEKITERFQLPEGSKEVTKTSALTNMAQLFRKFKSILNKDYVQKGLTSDIEHELQNQQAFWDDFVAFKRSEAATKVSEENKALQQKNVHPHVLGTSGYIKKILVWEQREQSPIASGVTSKTTDWQPRSKHWLFGRGVLYRTMGLYNVEIPESRK